MSGKEAHRIPPRQTSNARRLRRDATVPERLLWGRLRDRRWGDVKFRRQHPIGPYVTDFFCAEHNLVIELDGHSHDTTAKADLTREENLRKRGFRIIRFTNDSVIQDLGGVLEAIANAIEAIRAGSP